MSVGPGDFDKAVANWGDPQEPETSPGHLATGIAKIALAAPVVGAIGSLPAWNTGRDIGKVVKAFKSAFGATFESNAINHFAKKTGGHWSGKLLDTVINDYFSAGRAVPAALKGTAAAIKAATTPIPMSTKEILVDLIKKATIASPIILSIREGNKVSNSDLNKVKELLIMQKELDDNIKDNKVDPKLVDNVMKEAANKNKNKNSRNNKSSGGGGSMYNRKRKKRKSKGNSNNQNGYSGGGGNNNNNNTSLHYGRYDDDGNDVRPGTNLVQTSDVGAFMESLLPKVETSWLNKNIGNNVNQSIYELPTGSFTYAYSPMYLSHQYIDVTGTKYTRSRNAFIYNTYIEEPLFNRLVTSRGPYNDSLSFDKSEMTEYFKTISLIIQFMINFGNKIMDYPGPPTYNQALQALNTDQRIVAPSVKSYYLQVKAFIENSDYICFPPGWVDVIKKFYMNYSTSDCAKAPIVAFSFGSSFLHDNTYDYDGLTNKELQKAKVTRKTFDGIMAQLQSGDFTKIGTMIAKVKPHWKNVNLDTDGATIKVDKQYMSIWSESPVYLEGRNKDGMPVGGSHYPSVEDLSVPYQQVAFSDLVPGEVTAFHTVFVANDDGSKYWAQGFLVPTEYDQTVHSQIEPNKAWCNRSYFKLNPSEGGLNHFQNLANYESDVDPKKHQEYAGWRNQSYARVIEETPGDSTTKNIGTYSRQYIPLGGYLLMNRRVTDSFSTVDKLVTDLWE